MDMIVEFFEGFDGDHGGYDVAQRNFTEKM